MVAIDDFYTAVKPFLNTWTSVELRAIGDLRSGSLVSMLASLTSQPEPPNETETLEDIAFIKTSVPSKLLNGLLEQWKLGWLTIDDKKFSTANEFAEPTFQGYGPVTFGELRYCWPNLEKYLGWTLLSYGKRNFEMMVQPRDFLSLARSRNFTSTDEMIREKIGFPVGGSASTRIYLWAPLQFEVVIEVGIEKARVALEIPKGVSPAECFIRSRVTDERGTVILRKQIDLNGEIKDTSQSLEIELGLPGRSSHGEVEFCCKQYSGGVNPIAAARFDVPASGQPNPRWAMMKSIMQESSGFKGKAPEDYLKESLGLNRKLDKPDEFEIAVHQLLFLAGFSTLHIGRAEGVDLAFLGEKTKKQAILIGCTTGLLEQIEVAKLGFQRDQLRNELPGYEIGAAICVPHEIDQLTVGGVSECREKHISILAKSAIRQLVDLVTAGGWERAGEELKNYVNSPVPFGKFPDTLI